jgi:hypothetical protein
MYEELEKVAAECEDAASTFDRDPLDSIIRRSQEAAQSLASSASKSWAGYHANCYYGDFEPAEHAFSIEWGLHGPPYSTTRFATRWREYSHQEVIAEIERRSGVTNMDSLVKASEEARGIFARCKREVLTTLDAEMDSDTSAGLRNLQQKVSELEDSVDPGVLVHREQPSQIATRDRRFAFEGIVVPPHISYEAQVMALASCAGKLRDLAGLARTALAYFRKKEQRESRKPAPVAEAVPPPASPLPLPAPAPVPIPGVTPLPPVAQDEFDRPWDLWIFGALCLGVLLGTFGPRLLTTVQQVTLSMSSSLTPTWRRVVVGLAVGVATSVAGVAGNLIASQLDRENTGMLRAVLARRRVRLLLVGAVLLTAAAFAFTAA